jgi:hypothetical protein
MTREHLIDCIGSGLNHAAFLNEEAGVPHSFRGNDLRVARLVARAIGVKIADQLERERKTFNRAKFEAAVDAVVGPHVPIVTDPTGTYRI